MKASQLKFSEKPPVVVALGPRCFSSRWTNRPKELVHIGLRIASADEQLRAATEATTRADRLLTDPRVSKYGHDDERWQAVYEVCRLHYLLGYIMTSAQDVNAPFWAQQFGDILMCEQEVSEAGGLPIVSARFTDAGLERLFDEYDALCIASSPVWPPASDDELKRLGARLVDGSFLEGLTSAAKEGNSEAAHVEMQIRRFLHRVVHLRSVGRE